MLLFSPYNIVKRGAVSCPSSSPAGAAAGYAHRQHLLLLLTERRQMIARLIRLLLRLWERRRGTDES